MLLMLQILQLPLCDAPVSAWHDLHEGNAQRTRQPFTVSAPLAIINTASKHLHNDLARAIKALEQKKDLHEGNCMPTVDTACTGREAWWYLLRQSSLKVSIGDLATDSKLPPRC